MSSLLDYLDPSDEDFEELWSTAQIVPDTNVLLNAFRYAPNTAGQLIGTFEAVETRIWVPHQVAWEFDQNPVERLLGSPFMRIENEMEKARSILNRLFDELGSQDHPTLDTRPMKKQVDEATQSIRETVSEQQSAAADEDYMSMLRQKIEDLLDGKVGDPYLTDRLLEICEEGERRYELLIPPGYSDAKGKKGVARFGDLILWRQILDQSIRSGVPTIFITDDRKEDWYRRESGQTVGPRPELLEEHFRVTGRSVWIYSTPSFMEHARDHLAVSVDKESVSEVETTLDDAWHQGILRALEVRQAAENSGIETDLGTGIDTDALQRFLIWLKHRPGGAIDD